MTRLGSLRSLGMLLSLLALLNTVFASSGDRNPTFQHCLRGCSANYCEDPSQPPLPAYLRAFGWSCLDDCKYQCGHSFTDNIRPGGQWHQFYGKWPFYRLGPFQEPFSVLMSLGNLYVNLKGLAELKRRIRPENKLRRWLEIAGWAQVNTWLWSSVFHARDTPTTERLDYFSATITIAMSLLYAILRCFHLQTPLATSRYTYIVTAILGITILSHFTYLLSFPLGSFPYGYHTNFVLLLALTHNAIWILWSLSFRIDLPSFKLGDRIISFPAPYPPQDPRKVIPSTANTPALLVVLTTLAMSFELLDFSPVFRVVDAHSLWHMFTIPLAVAWWSFFCSDAIELEGSLLGMSGGGVGMGMDEKMPLSRGSALSSNSPVAGMAGPSAPVGTPRTPTFGGQLTAQSYPARPVSPGKERAD